MEVCKIILQHFLPLLNLSHTEAQLVAFNVFRSIYYIFFSFKKRFSLFILLEEINSAWTTELTMTSWVQNPSFCENVS